MSETPPPHHARRGFRNPWALGKETGAADILRWLWERRRATLPPDPPARAIPRAEPRPAEPRLPAAREPAATVERTAPRGDTGSGHEPAGACRITWIGHATFLIQLPGLNVLTDPILGRRASPVGWAGPARLSPPGLTVDALPPIDAVLLSHDHYDHLDRWTVDRLRQRFGDQPLWLTPLGYARWFRRRGVRNVVELDWWEHATREVGEVVTRIRALPARHWTRRRMLDARKRLWCSWSVEAGGRSVYFGGDSGYGPGFAEIGEREGPFDVVMLPIGAYEPRWFMRSSHMNPEEAVQACADLGGGAFVAMHWGTFRLTNEHPLEPPVRVRRAWAALGRPPDELHIPAVGETLVLEP